MQRRLGSICAELDVGVDRAAGPGDARVGEVSGGINPSDLAGEGALEPEHVSEGAQVDWVQRLGARCVYKRRGCSFRHSIERAAEDEPALDHEFTLAVADGPGDQGVKEHHGLEGAVGVDLIARNPAVLAKTPPVAEPEVEPYSLEEVRRLFRAAENERNGTRWVVALALGLRQGEALGLKWNDVDWQRALLTIRRSRTRPRYAHGCAPPCGHKYAGHCPARIAMRPDADTTKSKAGRRFVPVPAAVLELLRTHAEEQAEERANAAQLWRADGWLFATELGGPINPRTDWDSWKRLLTSAGVRDGRLHDARHTAATVLLLLGVHERTIMSVLGWSTTAMVGRYAHVIAPIHEDLATRLDGLLWSGPDGATSSD